MVVLVFVDVVDVVLCVVVVFVVVVDVVVLVEVLEEVDVEVVVVVVVVVVIQSTAETSVGVPKVAFTPLGQRGAETTAAQLPSSSCSKREKKLPCN